MQVLHLALATALCAVLCSPAQAKPPSPERTPQAIDGEPGDHVLTSARTGVRFKASSAPDTFHLYGGPGTQEGKFQTAPTSPGVLGHAPHDIIAGEWFGVDLTETPQYWQVSTFCAESLDGDGSSGGTGDGTGNLAWWAGRTAEQEPRWATAPGYGNRWNAQLEWRAPMLDPSVGQTVELSFAFHYDVEPIWDFFNVAYDSANTVKWVYSIDGSNTPFDAPGVQYPADVSAKPIVYEPQGYTTLDQEIVLRLIVTSDGAWSDEDGLWPTTCGAAVVDDITVSYTDGVQSHVDFSDIDNTNSWQPTVFPYAGDFSRVFPQFSDVDPCRENPTPMVGFVDDGRCPQNQANNAGDPPCESTGGTLMLADPYGLPGGWAVNYTGGLTQGLLYLSNDVWSPPIAWDLPGSEDDDVEVAGSKLRFSVWRDLSLFHGIYYVWRVRTSHDGGVTWSDFVNDNWIYYGSIPRWVNAEVDVTQYINALGPPTHMQLALGVYEGVFIHFPFLDPTPSPLFDNVALLKYRVGGPVISADEAYTFMDAFPQSGNADFATLAGRQNSDCRLDVRDVNTGMLNTPGDSMIVDVVATIPGTTVADVRAVWVLDTNPWFDDVRVAPPGTTVNLNGSLWGTDQWLGESSAYLVDSIENRYWIDMPDEDFLHPGEQLRYYVRATDSEGRVSTLPSRLEGFDTGFSSNGERYDPRFTVQALPSVRDDGLGSHSQPPVLMVNAFGFRGGVNEVHQVFDQNAQVEGVSYDVYTVRAPGRSASNGIGSAGAHGATAQQLSGYEVILYTSGDLFTGPSNGSDLGNNDKSDDIGVLTSWFQQDAKRAIAHFGDDTVQALMDDAGAAGMSYAQDVLGVDLVDDDVSDEIEQTAPLVVPLPEAPCFTTSFVAYGGCPSPNEFDSITARPGAVASHAFADASGMPLPGSAAGVFWSRLDGGGKTKSTLVFPYGLESIWDPSSPDPSPRSGRSRLVWELITDCFDRVLFGQTPTAAEATPFSGPRGLTAGPNPFNPTTVVSFELGSRTHVVVRLFDVRGQLVRTLHEGRLEAGPHRLPWNGRDRHDVPVASGVYVAQVEADGHKETIKIALIK